MSVLVRNLTGDAATPAALTFTAGFVEAGFFINVAFMSLSVFATPGK
jgi:hypothetical protein